MQSSFDLLRELPPEVQYQELKKIEAKAKISSTTEDWVVAGLCLVCLLTVTVPSINKQADNIAAFVLPSNPLIKTQQSNPLKDVMPSVSRKGYIWPVASGPITSGFGWRWGRLHAGLDFGVPVGTPVMASADGTVTYAGWIEGGYGNLVELKHGDGAITRYGHNDSVLVKVGQKVGQGEVIARSGNTGHSTGPHLHFEIRPTGGNAVDPLTKLPPR